MDETVKSSLSILNFPEVGIEKKSSKFEPDFCPIRLDSDPWIVQPTEHYEELSIEEIIKRN